MTRRRRMPSACSFGGSSAGSRSARQATLHHRIVDRATSDRGTVGPMTCLSCLARLPDLELSATSGCRPTRATRRVGQLDMRRSRDRELQDSEHESSGQRGWPDPSRMPRRPPTMNTSSERDQHRQKWRLTPDHRAEVVRRQARRGGPSSVVIGIAIAPNATGAVSATSATAAALHRLHPQSDEHDPADRHRAFQIRRVPRAARRSRTRRRATWTRGCHPETELERPAQHGEVPSCPPSCCRSTAR